MKLIALLFLSVLMGGVVFADQTASIAEDRQVEALQKFCDEGDAKMCFILGVNYKYGDFPFKQDYFKAAELYRRACDGGEAGGCWGLAWFYQYGKGVRQSKTEALKFYGKACDLKDQDGCDAYAKLNTSK